MVDFLTEISAGREQVTIAFVRSTNGATGRSDVFIALRRETVREILRVPRCQNTPLNVVDGRSFERPVV